MLRLGVDTGGTFTDFVLFDGATLRVHKVLSTPAAPERAIVRGIQDMGIDLRALRIVHGSTVATNAVLEGKGVRTAYITNRGLGDVLSLGRQARAELYDLQPQRRDPPVPAELCLETGGRLAADGSDVEALTAADLETLIADLRRLAPKAVAINLLFSFIDDRHERALAAALPDDLFVSCSSAVLPEYREYERGVSVWLNASIGPLMQGYLQRLEVAVAPAQVAVMQSSGGTMAAAQAGHQAVRLLLSGPAGGLMGARLMARALDIERIMTFDMGGTSTDVAVFDGEPALTSEGRIGGYPVAVPMVDMHTIGAGGGSIAYVDAGGLLQVGPLSAGADPGPACYGLGGSAATVTDANLVLGRLRPDAFLGGAMHLDRDAARAALIPLAQRLGLTVEEVAEGIVRIADEHIARALRAISVQRGVDPRSCALLSFGGAGGLHVCALAMALDLDRALVPVHAGVLSALGMLAAPSSRQLSKSVLIPIDEANESELQDLFAQLEADGRRQLLSEGVADAELQAWHSADLRYIGQSYVLNVPWLGVGASADEFHLAHQQHYGHALREPVELVNLRVTVRGAEPNVPLRPPATRVSTPSVRSTHVVGADTAVSVFSRAELVIGQTFDGPALITETLSTTYVAPDWRCCVQPTGTLELRRTGV